MLLHALPCAVPAVEGRMKGGVCMHERTVVYTRRMYICIYTPYAWPCRTHTSCGVSRRCLHACAPAAAPASLALRSKRASWARLWDDVSTHTLLNPLVEPPPRRSERTLRRTLSTGTAPRRAQAQRLLNPLVFKVHITVYIFSTGIRYI